MWKCRTSSKILWQALRDLTYRTMKFQWSSLLLYVICFVLCLSLSRIEPKEPVKNLSLAPLLTWWLLWNKGTYLLDFPSINMKNLNSKKFRYLKLCYIFKAVFHGNIFYADLIFSAECMGEGSASKLFLFNY